MNFLEKDLEEIIYETKTEVLREKGLHIYGKPKKQLRIGNYGIADLVYFKKVYGGVIHKSYLEITVVELKKDKIGISAFLQALGYVKGIYDYLTQIRGFYNFSFNIVLIGRNIDTNSNYVFLKDFINSTYSSSMCIESLDNYTYKYTLNGIEFKDHSNYSLIDKGFKNV